MQGHLAQIVHDGGGSAEAVDFFRAMTDEQFEEWKSRYDAIRTGQGKTLKPEMLWWEEEFRSAFDNLILQASKPIC
jgi:hypothetical protein